MIAFDPPQSRAFIKKATHGGLSEVDVHRAWSKLQSTWSKCGRERFMSD